MNPEDLENKFMIEDVGVLIVLSIFNGLIIIYLLKFMGHI